MAERFSRTNLSDQIRSALEKEILSGQLAAGVRLEEQALMQRFDVSRTPAREALLQLVAAGLASSVPRQGMVVSGVSLPEFVAMLEVVMELEGLAARLAARRMPAAQRKRLQQAAKACAKSAANQQAADYIEANRVFHELIYDGSCNEVLASQLRALRARMRSTQAPLFDRPGRIRNSVAEHEIVLAAILHGDEDGADRAMTTHISSGGNVYVDSVATLTQCQPVESANQPRPRGHKAVAAARPRDESKELAQ